MLRVYESVPFVIHKTVEGGIISLKFRFDELKETAKDASRQ